MIRQVEAKLALAPRLAVVLRGEDRPRDAAETVTFAGICQDRGQFADAARLYGAAFADDPKLSDDLVAGHRYRAACAASRAGSGHGKGGPSPDVEARARLLVQARDWLRADLAFRARQVDGGDAAARNDALQN